MSPADLSVRLEMRGVDRFTEGARRAMDALLQLAEAGQRAGAQMQLLGDAARTLQARRHRDRVARRADHRRVTRTIRQEARERLAERREERAYLRSRQYLEHHPDTAAAQRAARIAALRERLHTPTPRSTP